MSTETIEEVERTVPPAVAARFAQHTRIGPWPLAHGCPGRCLDWCAGKWADGSGKWNLDNYHPLRVHRWTFELAYGPIPAGWYCVPLCRRPVCCAPSHHRALPRGKAEKHINPRRKRSVKVTATDVTRMRALAAVGVPQAEIARVFKVSQSHVSEIVRRLVWQNVA